jgi:hypothetical protein
MGRRIVHYRQHGRFPVSPQFILGAGRIGLHLHFRGHFIFCLGRVYLRVINAQNNFRLKETEVPAFVPTVRLKAGDKGGRVLNLTTATDIIHVQHLTIKQKQA